jgi:hypothetical protein
MRGQSHETRYLEAKATGAVPAFGLCEITGATWEDPGRTVLLVGAPGADHAYPLCVNSHKPIAAGDYGLVACEGPVFCKYNTAATPIVGYAWGAASGSFLATKDKNGLLILGGVDTTKEVVLVDICRWEQYVNIITFTLAAALTTADESKTATISEQVGPGRLSPYTGAGEITVHNLPSVAKSAYEFYGHSGDYGRAAWMYGSHYKILIVECP